MTARRRQRSSTTRWTVAALLVLLVLIAYGVWALSIVSTSAGGHAGPSIPSWPAGHGVQGAPAPVLQEGTRA